MNDQVVVWNNDARYRPELEVEMELELVVHVVDDLDDALAHIDDDLAGGWFVDDGVPFVDDQQVIYDAPPPDYARAFRAAS